MNNVGIIDTFLNTFTTYIDSGFGLIKGEVGYLSSTLTIRPGIPVRVIVSRDLVLAPYGQGGTP